MFGPRVFRSWPAGFFLIASVSIAWAAGPAPIAGLTPAQERQFGKVYYNCDHGGVQRCLELTCASAKGADAAEIRYLYRETWNSFPELLTPALRACFVKAGGRFG